MFFKHPRWRKTRPIHRIISGTYQVFNKWFLMSKLALHFCTAIKVLKCTYIIYLYFITHKKTKYFLILHSLSINSSPQFECIQPFQDIFFFPKNRNFPPNLPTPHHYMGARTRAFPNIVDLRKHKIIIFLCLKNIF